MSDSSQPKKKLVLKKKAPGSAKKKGKKPLGKSKKATTGKQKTSSLPPPIVKAPPPTEAAPPAETPPSAPAGIEAPASSPKHEFYCPYCAKLNEVTTDDVGENISCPGCSEKIWVPPPPKGQAARVEPEPPKTFKFFCPLCGQKLSAPANAGGVQTVCPACNCAIAVPEPQIPPEIAKD
jgi:DNA-directed RNA polymerase subunit RPC12/RpoP